MTDTSKTPETPQEDTAPRKGRQLNVGRQLQKKRRERKLSIKQVSDQIRLRPEVLKAMEANEFADMSEPVYTRGFLRTYANFLGLNGQELVRTLERQEQLPGEREMNMPTPVDEGALPSRGIIIVSLGVILLIALVWQGVSWLTPETRDTLPDMPRAVPEDVVTPASAPEAAPAPETPAPAFRTPEAVEEAPADETTADALPAEVVPQPVPPRPEGARIRFYAEQDVWLRVKSPEMAEPLISEVLPGGHSYWVPAREGLLLDVGLPPALIVFIDGERMGKSGMIDRRVWDLPLEPDNLKESYFGQDVHLTPNVSEKSEPETAAEGGGVPNVVVEDDEVIIQPARDADDTPQNTSTENNNDDSPTTNGLR